VHCAVDRGSGMVFLQVRVVGRSSPRANGVLYGKYARKFRPARSGLRKML
jgi:hypothetical protein